jgi:hypothetical protein
MSIYDINYNNVVGNMIAPFLRTASLLKWMYALISPIQWLRDRFFYNYVNSDLYVYCDGVTPLIINYAGTLVKFIDNSLWETQIDNVDTSVYNPTIGQVSDINGNTIWIKIQDDFVGLNERVMYSNQKMLFEYLLNNYFKHDISANNIYINTNDISHNMVEIAEEDVDSFVIAQNDIDSLYWISEWDVEKQEFNFKIFVPTLIATQLGTNYQQIISQIVDRYNYFGLIYNYLIY